MYICNMILIIDDDISIRASLSFMLKRAGYEVVAVASPKEQSQQFVILRLNLY